MYPEVAPTLELRETISHPIRSEEVIGFSGRNKMLGRKAIVLKEAAISNRKKEPLLQIPQKHYESLNDGAELILLREMSVLCINGAEAVEETKLTTHQGRGDRVTIPELSVLSDGFKKFSSNGVDISN